MIEPKDLPQIKSIVDHAISENLQASQYAPTSVALHKHTGVDSSQVAYITLTDKRLIDNYTIQGTNASATSSYSVFFIAPVAMRLFEVRETHAVAGTDGSAVTLNIEKLTGTLAPGSGTLLLNNAFNLKGAINTVTTGTITTFAASFNLAQNDRLAFVLTGTPTSVQNVSVSVTLGF